MPWPPPWFREAVCFEDFDHKRFNADDIVVTCVISTDGTMVLFLHGFPKHCANFSAATLPGGHFLVDP